MGFKKLIDLDLLDRFLTGVKALIPSTYAGSSSAGGPATVANGIPYGVVDGTSTKTAFTATVSGVTSLYDGLVILLKNNVVASASGCTLNVNSLGAKPIHYSTALNTGISTTYSATMTALFYYDSTRNSGNGAWVFYYGYDANTNTIGYQIRTNSMSLPMSDIVYRYRLLFTSADGTKFVPANTSTSTNATTARSVCQTKINPFGRIVYYGTTASVAANSRPSTSYLWQQYNVTLGYSFNVSGGDLALTSWKPCYLKCAPQSDGSAIMDSATPIVQELPTTEDGKIYIFLGIASAATTMELTLEHPVYYYANGCIRPWVNQNGSGGSAESFIVNVTQDPNTEEYQADKTYTEIKSAIDNGLAVFARLNPVELGTPLDDFLWYALLEETPYGITFYAIYVNDAWGGEDFHYARLFVSTGNEWSIDYDSTTIIDESMEAESGGTDLSLVTTDEKYVWNLKYDASNPPPYPVTSVNGKTGAVSLDASDVGALPSNTSIPSKTSDLTNDSGFITGMTILSYGTSTWQDFLSAYNADKVVYCRASSNANPATGEQLRMAFMAYIGGTKTNPTSVEFQYYRSVSTHSDAQQGDQVYIYKLTSSNVWTVTVREAYTKIATGTGLSKSYANGTLTIANTVTAPEAATATPLVAGTAAVGSSAKFAREDHVHPEQTTINGHTVASDVPANAVFTDTTYSVVSKQAAGLAPQLPDENTTTKFLRQDGTWAEPSGDGKSLVVTITKSGSTYSSDVEYDDIVSAMAAGAVVEVRYNNSNYIYTSQSGSYLYFKLTSVNTNRTSQYQISIYKSNGLTKVSYGSYSMDIPSFDMHQYYLHPEPEYTVSLYTDPETGIESYYVDGETYPQNIVIEEFGLGQGVFAGYFPVLRYYKSNFYNSYEETGSEDADFEEYRLVKAWTTHEWREITDSWTQETYYTNIFSYHLLFAITVEENGTKKYKTFEIVSDDMEHHNPGDWIATYSETSLSTLPSVSASDNGKFLCVNNGAWAAVTVPAANGVSF